MRITLDTDKGIFIVPNTFKKNLEKQNEILDSQKQIENLFNFNHTTINV